MSQTVMTNDELQRIVDSAQAHTPMTVMLAKELLSLRHAVFSAAAECNSSRATVVSIQEMLRTTLSKSEDGHEQR